MKILWVTSAKTSLLNLCEGGLQAGYAAGWQSALGFSLLENPDNELCVCYPHNPKDGKPPELASNKYQLLAYGYPVRPISAYKGVADIGLIFKRFVEIFDSFSPDIIHIHGSEFQSSYAAILAAASLGRLGICAVSIQGLVSVYANHFYGHIPPDERIRKTLREWIKSDGIKDARRHFIRRGKYERLCLESASHIIGRTTWDFANASLINPKFKYHFCNEILRDTFYEGRWDYAHCRKYSIFVSQANVPYKGFHMVLTAMSLLKKRYPDILVYVSGEDLTKRPFLRGNSYGNYLKKLISQYGLENNVCFLGVLDDKQMKIQMLQANVFVSPSSIENSPNSLGEAMLLALPCVASNVGGVSDMMTHELEGYLYPSDAPDMLAYYIDTAFARKDRITPLGLAAQKRAQITHNKQKNTENMLAIYKEIAGKGV